MFRLIVTSPKGQEQLVCTDEGDAEFNFTEIGEACRVKYRLEEHNPNHKYALYVELKTQ